MTVAGLLERQERARARAMARRGGFRLALAGSALLALALFLERAGFDLPLLALPDPAGRPLLWGYLLVSISAFAQALLLLSGLVAASLALSFLSPPLLRRAPARTAAELDRRLSTDRYSAALEATGPLAPRAWEEALEEPPGPGVLAPALPGRLSRILLLLAILLALAVALLPGVRASGQRGSAPVAGVPEEGGRPVELLLRLTGPEGTFLPAQPIPLTLFARSPGLLREGIQLAVSLRIDSEPPREVPGVLRLAAGEGSEAELRFELRAGDFGRRLEPGDHVAVALAGGAESNPWPFRVEGMGSESRPPPPEPRPEEAGGGPEAAGRKPERKPRFVEPLVREGEQVEKRARVPIEAPDGGAASDRPLPEAWPELERRKEAALARPGLSPEARALIRDYFERLRPK